MGLQGEGGSFLSRMGGTFGVSDVVVVNKPGTADEKRQDIRAHVQGSKAYFDLDAPVYKGDEIHLADPRGGSRVLYVTNIKINDPQGATAFSGMGHIVASFSDTAPRPSISDSSGRQVFNAPVIIVSGGQANVAWDGGTTNTQNVAPIAEGFENLARALTQAIELISSAKDIEPDDREIAEEATTAALTEITKSEPDRKRIKRALAALRGIILSATKTASGEAAKLLIQSLMIP